MAAVMRSRGDGAKGSSRKQGGLADSNRRKSHRLSLGGDEKSLSFDDIR